MDFTCSVLLLLSLTFSLSVQIEHQHRHEAKDSSEFYSISLKVKKKERSEGESLVDVYYSIVKLLEQCGNNQLNDISSQVPTNSKVMKEDSNVLSDAVDTIEGTTPNNKHENFQKLTANPVNKGTTSIGSNTLTTEEGEGSEFELPAQCTSMRTLNLTESGRSQRYIGDLTYDSKFLDGGRVWFRFRGSAGIKLADSCEACGKTTYNQYSYWSNSSMPTQLGETMSILFYYGCKPLPKDIFFGSATKCNENFDDGLVYQFEDEMSVSYGTICGMS